MFQEDGNKIEAGNKRFIICNRNFYPGIKITYRNFSTSPGDYRYLDGMIVKDSLLSYPVLMAHMHFFLTKVEGNKMKGIYLSGNHWKEKWVAERNEKIELPDPDSLTFLKSGYDKINFSFPDLTAILFILSDKKFQNKVMVYSKSWVHGVLIDG